MPLSWLDILLVVIMLISGLLAMLRGFTREVLSILSWVVAAGAAGAAVFLRPELSQKVGEYIQPEILAKGVLAAVVFIVVLVVLSFITMRLSDRLMESRIGALDRTLGLIFGFARGLLILVVAYYFFNLLVPEKSQPQWVRDARSLPILKSTGEAVAELLPENLAADLRQFMGKDDPAAPGDRTDANGAKPRAGYPTGERRGLNQLLESTKGAKN